MGIFGSKKKFGLVQALVVVGKKPDITPDGAKTGAAFVEALGLPVTVVAEAELKIAELETSVAEMQEGLKTANDGLKEAETETASLISTLKTAAKTTIEAIGRVVLKKVDKIEDVREKKVAALEKKIDKVCDGAAFKADDIREWGENLIAKANKEMNKKVAAAEAKHKEDIADLKLQITNLELETEAAKNNVSIFTKIKTLFA